MDKGMPPTRGATLVFIKLRTSPPCDDCVRMPRQTTVYRLALSATHRTPHALHKHTEEISDP